MVRHYSRFDDNDKSDDDQYDDRMWWLDLTPIVRRLVNEDGLRDETEALACIDEYKRFLMMVIDNDMIMVPSDRVWRVWCRHVLDVKNYIRDCGRLLAGTRGAEMNFIHHIPVEAQLSADGRDKLTCAYEATRTAYADKFYGGDLKQLNENPLWSVNEPGRGFASVGSVLRRLEDNEPSLTIDSVDLRSAVARLVRDHEDEMPNDEYVKECVVEYRRFLRLAIRKPLGMTPSRAVDLVWHEHLLDTRKYQEDCLRMTGTKRQLLYHNPHYSKPAVYHESGFQRTRQLYEAEFGQVPPDSVWGMRGESGGCESYPSAKPPIKTIFFNCCGAGRKGDDPPHCALGTLWFMLCSKCHEFGVCRCITCRGAPSWKASIVLCPPFYGCFTLLSYPAMIRDCCEWFWCSRSCQCCSGDPGCEFEHRLNIEKKETYMYEWYVHDARRYRAESCWDGCKFICCVDHDMTSDEAYTASYFFSPPKIQFMSLAVRVEGAHMEKDPNKLREPKKTKTPSTVAKVAMTSPVVPAMAMPVTSSTTSVSEGTTKKPDTSLGFVPARHN